ncbi:MAG: ribose-5-phosphate isomerase RpiA [Rhodospirillales bacterium]
MSQQDQKERVGKAAADLVESGMTLGLGTGSTAACFIQALAERGLRPRCVATSEATAVMALGLGFDVVGLDVLSKVDLTVDGVDEVDANLTAIKGGGGALMREKIVASISETVVYIGDDTKLVDRLGKFPLPIEVSPFASSVVLRKISDLGAKSEIRLQDGKPFVSDEGHWIIDAAFEVIEDPYELDVLLNMTPGVVAHGLFIDLIDRMLLMQNGDVVALDRPQ